MSQTALLAITATSGSQFVPCGFSGSADPDFVIIMGTTQTTANAYADGVGMFVGMADHAGGSGETACSSIWITDNADTQESQHFSGNTSFIRVDNGAGTTQVAATFGGVGGGGFTITWTTAMAGMKLYALAVAGIPNSDVTKWTKRITTGKDDVASPFAIPSDGTGGLIFLPTRDASDAISAANGFIGIGAQTSATRRWSAFASDQDNVATSNSGYRQSITSAISTTTAGSDTVSSEGVVSDWTTSSAGNGVQFQWPTTVGGAAEREHVLLMAGVPMAAIDWTTPTSTGSYDLSGVGFQPIGALHVSVYGQAAGTGQEHFSFMVGMVDTAGAQGAILGKAVHAASVSDTKQANYNDRAIALGPANTTTTLISGAHTSWLPDGERFSFSAVEAATPRRVMSFFWGTTSTPTTSSRTVPMTGAILATRIRSVPTTGAIHTTRPARTVPMTGAILVKRIRSVTATGAVITRPVRTVPMTGAIELSNLHTRSVPATGAILTLPVRSVPMTGTILISSSVFRMRGVSRMRGGNRLRGGEDRLLVVQLTVPTTGAILILPVRTVPTEGAIRTFPVLTVPTTGAILDFETLTVPMTGAISVLQTRSVPTTGALDILRTRSVPMTGSVSLIPSPRTVPTTGAILIARTRSAPTTGAVLIRPTRLVDSFGAISVLQTRSVPTTGSIVVVGKGNRSVPTTGAILTLPVRTVPMTGPIVILPVRSVPTAGAILTLPVRSVPSTGALIIGALFVRVVPMTGSIDLPPPPTPTTVTARGDFDLVARIGADLDLVPGGTAMNDLVPRRGDTWDLVLRHPSLGNTRITDDLDPTITFTASHKGAVFASGPLEWDSDDYNNAWSASVQLPSTRGVVTFIVTISVEDDALDSGIAQGTFIESIEVQ